MQMSDLEGLFGKPAVAARLATADDPASEVLTLGVDFAYLKVEEDGQLTTNSTDVAATTPRRLVVDADSFLHGLDQREHPPQPGTPEAALGWLIAVTTDGRLIQVPTGTNLSGE
jgi:hypothetical protein